MIELQGLQKVIDQRTVLDIPSLRVEAGEIVALVGPAGSGKGALLDLLLGRTLPSAGTVRVAGLDPRAEPDRFARQVGVLFFEDGLYPHLGPLDNLRFHCGLHDLPTGRALEILRLVGLADQAKAKLKALSTGMSRRLAFGRAILHSPSVLLMVEPFARCDEASISLMSSLLRDLAESGVAVLILASDAGHLSGLCSSVRLLHQGKVVETSQPSADQPGSPRTFKIPVRLEGSVALINPAEVFYAEAEEGRAFLHTAEGPIPTQYTMAEIEQRLMRSGFFRAHRGYLVNLQHVKEVIPFTRNSFSLRLDDAAGTLIPLSKAAAAELRELLGY
jgi:ABC-2 type transport system ATP-binding protein